MKRGSLTVSTNYDLAPANLNANPNFRGVDLSIVNREKKLDLELIGSSLENLGLGLRGPDIKTRS